MTTDPPPQGASLGLRSGAASFGLELAVRGALAVQAADAERRDRLRLRRLAAVLGAAAEVPYYRRLWAERGSGEPGSDFTALRDLPAFTKGELLEAGEEARVRSGISRDRLHRVETSGSTGRALSMFATNTETLQMTAYLAWGWRQGGVRPDDRGLLLAAPYLAAFEREGWAFVPPEASPGWILERFRELRPTVLIGSTESIALLARDVTEAGIDAGHVRLLFPFGQTLSPRLRGMMREAFAPRPLDLYGCREAGWLGTGCEEDRGLHVPDASVEVEIVKMGDPTSPAPPGQLGEVVVTSLLRRTTPFVRYRIGDVAALDSDPCPCGRDTPRLVRLEGRVQDLLLAADGRPVSPGVVATAVAYGRPGILDHRIVQEAPDRMDVVLVVDDAFPDDEPARIREELRRHLGPLAVTVRLVEEIPRDPSGKRRRVYRAFALPGEAS